MNYIWRSIGIMVFSSMNQCESARWRFLEFSITWRVMIG